MSSTKAAFGGKPSSIVLARLDKALAPADGALVADASGLPKSGYLTPFIARGPMPVCRYGVVFDGNDYLVVSEVGVKERQITGWRVSADGKLQGDPSKGFDIAVVPGKNEILPSAAAGPEGATLVVYSEIRGADDIKVLARIVK